MNFGKLLSGGGGNFIDSALDKVAEKLSGSRGDDDSAVLDPSKMEHYGEAAPISGKRKAVLIGINYKGTKQELGGCINDVRRVLAWIQKTAPFNDVLILTDEGEDPAKLPTRENILNAFRWLVSDAQPGDSLFLHYSGHGATQADTDGDEVDHMDSTIVPLDYNSAGQISDDEIHSTLCAPLPAGARLTTIMDCCHSGSILDLPYTYLPDGNLEIVMIDNRKAAIRKGLQAGLEWARGDRTAALKAAREAFGLYVKPAGSSEAQRKTEKEKTTRGFVVSFSGCLDEQTSADANIHGERSGALSWAILETLGENPHATYANILKTVREKLHGKYSQIAQLSTGFPIDINSQIQI